MSVGHRRRPRRLRAAEVQGRSSRACDAKLPLPTRMLLAVTDFLDQLVVGCSLGGLVALVARLFVASLRTDRGQLRARRAAAEAAGPRRTRSSTPLVERFCRILGSMVSAGVPLPEALRVATEALRNLVYSGRLDEVSERDARRRGLAGPLAATGLFPGDRRRRCSGSARRPARSTPSSRSPREYYERELDYKIKKLTALFEPAVIVVMGAASSASSPSRSSRRCTASSTRCRSDMRDAVALGTPTSGRDAGRAAGRRRRSSASPAVAIVAGLQLSVTASDIHRKQTTGGAYARELRRGDRAVRRVGNGPLHAAAQLPTPTPPPRSASTASCPAATPAPRLRRSG